MRVNFQCYPAKQTVRFSCLCCGKKNRTRTFSAECTVNPFNEGSDGIPLNAKQVAQQSKDRVAKDVKRFQTEPLCATCEGDLSWDDRKALGERRRGGMTP